jgi:hypothetical protein
VNLAPSLTVPASATIDYSETFQGTATATDQDSPGNGLTYSLTQAPIGATIHPQSGQIIWTPQPTESNASHTFEVKVVDDGTPVLSDIETFTVAVNKLEVAVALVVPYAQIVNELETIMASLSAVESTDTGQQLQFSLDSAPAGVSLTIAGLSTASLTWTPTEAQGAGVYSITCSVSGTYDGSTVTDTRTFSVEVKEVNQAPVLTIPSTATIDFSETYSATATATDADSPINGLSFSLTQAPEGASIDSNSGQIQWTPTLSETGATHTFAVKVVDDGSPQLSDSKSFSVLVNEFNVALDLVVPETQSINETDTLTFGLSATDPQDSGQQLVFNLDSAPEGMTLITTGLTTATLSWTPSEEQGAGVYAVTCSVSATFYDILYTETKIFSVDVKEINQAPVITVPDSSAVEHGGTYTARATANDPDIPINNLSFSLTQGPGGATIDPESGQIQWLPELSDTGVTHSFEVKVVDDGTPQFSDTKSFNIRVESLQVNLSITPISKSEQKIVVTGPTGYSYTLEKCFNLKAWTLFSEFDLVTESTYEIIVKLDRNKNVFYRVMIVGVLPSE